MSRFFQLLALFLAINFINAAIIVQDQKVLGKALNQSSTLVANDKKVQEQNDEVPIKVLQEVIDDYTDLSNAFYSPAQNETIREKRTLGVLRNIQNRTRAGIATVRTLFSTFNNSPTGMSFRTFFSNLLNRVLIFLTNLWDRITGLFRRNNGESGSGGSGGGFFSRILGRFRPGGGSGGGLFSFLRPTTTESYSSDFSYFSTAGTSSTTEKTDSDSAGSNGVDSGRSLGGGYSDSETAQDFIPFPDDDNKEAESGIEIRSNAPKASESKLNPVIVDAPAPQVFTIDDGRRF